MTAPKKQSMVLRVLVVMFAVFLFLVALSGFALYRWAQDPETRKQLGAAQDVFEMTMKASRAPGAKELQALGCRQAAVFDAEQADAYFRSIGHLTRNSEGDGELDVPLIMCGVPPKHSLGCDEVTKTYTASIESPPEELMVMVQSQGFPQRALCAGFYRPDGTLIEAIPIDQQ